MDGFNWDAISKDTKKQILFDIWSDIDSPCSYEGHDCPLTKYGLDCEKDNNRHCLVRDFIIECTKIE